MSNAAAKAKIVEEFQVGNQDTGSPEVQIALLTDRIQHLTEHFKKHKHDFHSRRGLLTFVSRRNRLLQYLRRTSIERYRKLITRLNIRDKWAV